MKDGQDKTGRRNRWQNLHALECATGCTPWICNVFTTLDHWPNDCSAFSIPFSPDPLYLLLNKPLAEITIYLTLKDDINNYFWSFR